MECKKCYLNSNLFKMSGQGSSMQDSIYMNLDELVQQKVSINVFKHCKIYTELEEHFVNRIKYASVYLKNEAYVVDDVKHH